MIYILEPKAGEETLFIKGELHKYLIKVRRHTLGDVLGFRSKESIKTLHHYEIVALEPRVAQLKRIKSEELEVKSSKNLHIAWCIIDAKSIEKVLASLCEIGVNKISFISCDRSQKNFKLDFKRFERIVEASMQQSGRTSIMEFDRYASIESFISEFPQTKVFDFTETILENTEDFREVLVGCEGGFSPKEKEFLQKQEVFRLSTPMILRSESALLAVSSKILL